MEPITIPGLNDMSPQEVFDKVSDHLLTQNKRSMSDPLNGMCMYRGAEDLKCAAGALIPDNLYKPEMEGVAADSFLNTPHRGIIRDLQLIHDTFEAWSWPEKLAKLASVHGLEYKGAEYGKSKKV